VLCDIHQFLFEFLQKIFTSCRPGARGTGLWDYHTVLRERISWLTIDLEGSVVGMSYRVELAHDLGSVHLAHLDFQSFIVVFFSSKVGSAL